MSTAAKRRKSEGVKEPKSLIGLFMGTPISDHVPRNTTGDVPARKVGPVMVVQRDESLPRVFRKLAVEGFLSAPVLEGSRYVGFIDMMDLVQKTKDLFWGDNVEAWVDFWDKEERFASTTVDDIMKTPNMWTRDPAPPIGREYSTFSALEMIVRGGFHRLAVVSPTRNRLEGIITQSMFISWLRQNRDLISGSLRTMLVSDMVEESKTSCEVVTETSPVINAFSKMANEGISGLAVVDDDGLLVSGISIRDLRGVGTSGEYFHRLFKTIREFKRLEKEDYPKLVPRTHYSTRNVPRKGLFVTPDQTFLDVLTKMADGNIHRVFVCEHAERPKPSHVISQGDLLRAVLDHMLQDYSTSEAGYTA